MKIASVAIQIIPDSQGGQTLEATLNLAGTQVIASVPSGKSTGSHEAFVLDPHLALQKLDKLRPHLLSTSFNSLQQFDHFLIDFDATPNKSNLGGNLILVLSTAFTKAWAKIQYLEPYQLISQLSHLSSPKMPYCFFNLIEGGQHVKHGLPFQEYLFIPNTLSAQAALNITNQMLSVLSETLPPIHGDEGGYAVDSFDPETGLAILDSAQKKLGFDKSYLGLDVAASTFYHNGSYAIPNLPELYSHFVSAYHLLSLEDPFSETDPSGFAQITSQFGEQIWIIGDDLTVTNPDLMAKAHQANLINAVIIKPTQIGSVSETIQAIELAKSYNWKVVVSHRGEETLDTFIADLAIGAGANGFKSGCPSQSQRLVKYQRLIEIEKHLNSQANH